MREIRKKRAKRAKKERKIEKKPKTLLFEGGPIGQSLR
jgi:hypothetical protein